MAACLKGYMYPLRSSNSLVYVLRVAVINLFKMGGCSAEFCNNSSSKGYIMKVFPRNSKRREIWAKSVSRKDWTPTNNSYLCEVK